MGTLELGKNRCQLSDSEWISLLNAEADGLPRCCANISALRDQIGWIVRDGFDCAIHAMNFLREFRVCQDGHDLTKLVTLQKLRQQIETFAGISLDELHHEPTVGGYG